LLAAAGDLRFQADRGGAAADVEGADALGAVEFVGREAHQVDAESADVDGDLADGLRGVGVQRDAALTADRGDLSKRLDDADFVVGEHHRDKRGVVADCRGDGLRVKPAGPRTAMLFHAEQSHAVTAATEAGEGVEHGLMLRGDADQMVAASARAFRDAADGEVVALGGAAGEDDLGRVGIDRGSDFRARLLNRLARGGAEGVTDAAGVAVILREIRQHRVEHARVDAGGGVIVEVDGQGKDA
jgi:hypothetical protein